MITEDQYLGCFLGLVIGDVYGAAFEGGILERLLWILIGKTKTGQRRYTDDTQMSIDIATSFLDNREINQSHLALTFAQNYTWSRGYGTGTARLLKKIKKGAIWTEVNRSTFKEGSFGNGAAMRAPILALCFSQNQTVLLRNVIKSAEITHAHPQAIEGAKIIALATYGALHQWKNRIILDCLIKECHLTEYKTKIDFCLNAIENKKEWSKKMIQQQLGNGIAATQSCITALYFALQYREQKIHFLIDKINDLGGDTDTISAMAGAIWGAFNGFNKLPQDKINNIEKHQKIMQLASQLYSTHYF